MINNLKQSVQLLNLAFQKNYITETDSTLNVSFLAFHYLDDDEEINFLM